MGRVYPEGQRSLRRVAAIVIVGSWSAGFLGCDDHGPSRAALDRRKQAVTAEVEGVLSGITVRQEQAFAETGTYAGAGTATVPAAVPSEPAPAGALPGAWKTLRLQLPDKLYCRYAIVAGKVGQPIPAEVVALFRVTEEIAVDWFVATAECDADLDPKINSHYMTSSFRPFLSKVNAGL